MSTGIPRDKSKPNIRLKLKEQDNTITRLEKQRSQQKQATNLQKVEPVDHPFKADKLAAYVMTSDEAEWTKTLKRKYGKTPSVKLNVLKLIVKRLFTTKEITLFKSRRQKKGTVFDMEKISLLRQMYFWIYSVQEPKQENEWDACWQMLVQAIESIWNEYYSQIGQTHTTSSLPEKKLNKPRANAQEQLGHKEHRGRGRPCLKDKQKQNETDTPPGHKEHRGRGRPRLKDKQKQNEMDTPPVQSYQVPINLIDVLKCFSWDSKLVVQMLLCHLFTSDELLQSISDSKTKLNPGKVAAVDVAFKSINEFATSGKCLGLIQEIMKDLPKENCSELWDIWTQKYNREEVENCAKVTGFAQQRAQIPTSRHIDYSSISREFADLPQDKEEKCVYVANKLAELFFSLVERAVSNTEGAEGLSALDPCRMAVLKHALFKIADVPRNMQKAVWKNACDAIDSGSAAIRKRFLEAHVDAREQLGLKEHRGRGRPRVKTQLVPEELANDVKSHARNRFIVIQKLEKYMMPPSSCSYKLDETYCSKMTVLRGVFLEACTDSKDDKEETWKEALRTLRYMHSLSKFTLRKCPFDEKSAQEGLSDKPSVPQGSIDKPSMDLVEQTCKLPDEKQDSQYSPHKRGARIDRFDAVSSSRCNLARDVRQQNTKTPKFFQLNKSISHIHAHVMEVLKCFSWNEDIVVRVLLQHLFSTEELVRSTKKYQRALATTRLSSLTKAFSCICGDGHREKCIALVKQTCEGLSMQQTSLVCSSWTKTCERDLVEKYAQATNFQECVVPQRTGMEVPDNTESDTSGKTVNTVETAATTGAATQAFISEEFPSLPADNMVKCMLVAKCLRKRFFTSEELVFGSCAGPQSWLYLDPKRLAVMRHVILTVGNVSKEEQSGVWRKCEKLINTKNKVLRNRLLEEDRKVENSLKFQPQSVLQRIPEASRRYLEENGSNASVVIKGLIQHLFHPAEQLSEFDEMVPSKMKLLKEMFFRISKVSADKEEETWREALRTVGFLDPVTTESSSKGDASITDKEHVKVTFQQDTDHNDDRERLSTVRKYAKDTCSPPRKEMRSRIPEHSVTLRWYALQPVVLQLHKHLETLEISEKEVIEWLIMHIFNIQEIMAWNTSGGSTSWETNMDLLRRSFFEIYNVPQDQKKRTSKMLEDEMLSVVESLRCQLLQYISADTSEVYTDLFLKNESKPYPAIPLLSSKINEMRFLLMSRFTADERINYCNRKLKGLQKSRVDAVMKEYMETFKISDDERTSERKDAMSILYNLTTDLQDIVASNVRHVLDHFSRSIIENDVLCLGNRALKQESSPSALFQEVLRNLTNTREREGLVGMIRVLLKYLFTADELSVLAKSDPSEYHVAVQTNMVLLQKTFFKVRKTPADDQEKVWSCVKWIISREVQKFSSEREVQRNRPSMNTILPSYCSKEVLACIVRNFLSSEEQTEFRKSPHEFEERFPDRVTAMKRMYFEIRNTKASGLDQEWHAVCTSERRFNTKRCVFSTDSSSMDATAAVDGRVTRSRVKSVPRDMNENCICMQMKSTLTESVDDLDDSFVSIESEGEDFCLSSPDREHERNRELGSLPCDVSDPFQVGNTQLHERGDLSATGLDNGHEGNLDTVAPARADTDPSQVENTQLRGSGDLAVTGHDMEHESNLETGAPARPDSDLSQAENVEQHNAATMETDSHTEEHSKSLRMKEKTGGLVKSIVVLIDYETCERLHDMMTKEQYDSSSHPVERSGGNDKAVTSDQHVSDQPASHPTTEESLADGERTDCGSKSAERDDVAVERCDSGSTEIKPADVATNLDDGKNHESGDIPSKENTGVTAECGGISQNNNSLDKSVVDDCVSVETSRSESESETETETKTVHLRLRPRLRPSL